jgi:hypothetical protein
MKIAPITAIKSTEALHALSKLACFGLPYHGRQKEYCGQASCCQDQKSGHFAHRAHPEFLPMMGPKGWRHKRSYNPERPKLQERSDRWFAPKRGLPRGAARRVEENDFQDRPGQ